MRSRLAYPVAAAVALTVLGTALLGPARAEAADPVIVAAGDMACDPDSGYFNSGNGDATHCRQRYTSDLLLSPGVTNVLVLGDTQYEDGRLWKFQDSYAPSWGRSKSTTRPAIGNHEYRTTGGAGYFDYFNGVGGATGPAGDRSKGYYSFDVTLPSGAKWHVVSLNSNCSQVGGCHAGSPQEQWLNADLAANQTQCTVAYSHHPLFSSGGIGNNTSMQALWQALYDAGADVGLAGHDHNYERFAPQDATGVADAPFGIRQFVVGTGGKSLLGMGTIKPNSEVRQNDSFGVLELTLRDGSYDWRFKPEAGRTFADSGSGSCHGAPAPVPPTVSTDRASAITESSATLNATINPKKQPTKYHFEWGPSETYGSTTPEETLPQTDNADRQVSASLSGLTNGATYHYRIVATNASGTSRGQDRTFTTGTTSASPYATEILGTPGLLSYWRLGESTGTTALDEKKANPGTYRAGYTLGQSGALTGDPDTAVSFDGSSGETTASGPTLTTAGTLEGWFYWQKGTALLRDNTSSGGWILAYDSSGTVRYRVGGKTFDTGLSTASVRNGWHHFAVTKDGGNVAFYLDGKAVRTGTGAANTATAMPWHIMRNGTLGSSGGQADEVAVYGTALSAATIQRHYDVGKGR